ncbi:MAG: VOC family protein [Alphaproteobacteria bacterium]|nr:VOC family protein [Alphaproteobacteria bacterium]
MEQRVSLITLGVADLERARAFYDALGWSRSVRAAEGVVFYQIGGMALSLYPRADLARDMGLSDDGGGVSGMALAFNARSRDEVDSTLAEAEAAGATILKAADDTFWGGYAGSFADPDGFAWEVAWNPHFPLSEDGALILPD